MAHTSAASNTSAHANPNRNAGTDSDTNPGTNADAHPCTDADAHPGTNANTNTGPCGVQRGCAQRLVRQGSMARAGKHHAAPDSPQRAADR